MVCVDASTVLLAASVATQMKKQKVKKQVEQVVEQLEQSRSGRKRKRPLKFDEYY